MFSSLVVVTLANNLKFIWRFTPLISSLVYIFRNISLFRSYSVFFFLYIVLICTYFIINLSTKFVTFRFIPFWSIFTPIPLLFYYIYYTILLKLLRLSFCGICFDFSPASYTSMTVTCAQYFRLELRTKFLEVQRDRT